MGIERLSAADQMMRRVDEVWPQDNGALLIIDGSSLTDSNGRFQLERVTRLFEARLALVPRFRQVIRTPRRGLGPPLWVDAPAFDLSHHLQVRALPAPAGEAELLRAVEELRRERLTADQPLWQVWCLTGLPDRRVGVFAKVNHAIADGMAVMGAVSVFLDADPGVSEAVVRPWRPHPAPSSGALLADNVRRRVAGAAASARALLSPKAVVGALSMLPALRELFAEQPATPSSLDRVAGDHRRLVLIRSSLQTFKDFARASGASVNDALLTVVAAGLRALLAGRDELTPGFTVRAYVPVSLRSAGGEAVQGNAVAEMIVPLPVALAEPSALIGTISAETRRRKARARSTLSLLFGSSLISGLLLKALDRQRVNLTTANLRGSPVPLSLCGAKVLEVFPVLPLIGKAALGVAAVSYAGAFNIAVVADQKGYPDLDVFVAGAREQLAASARSAPRTMPVEAPRGAPPPPAGKPEPRAEAAP